MFEWGHGWIFEEIDQCECVCVYVYVCVYVCVYMCVRVCVRACACVHVRACM